MKTPLLRIPDFQLLLSEKQFRAIGHMIVQWAFLESEMNREIAWLLSRCEHKGKHINFQERFAFRASRWAELARHSYQKHPERIKAVDRITGRAIKLKPERDNIAHGTMGSSGIFFKMRGGRMIDISDTVGKPEYIEDLACRIAVLNADLHGHQNALRKHYRRSP